MRTIKCLLVLVLVFGTSCEDFLEENTDGLLSSSSLFGSNSESEPVLFGLYGQFSSGDMYSGSVTCLDLGTDITTRNRNGTTVHAPHTNYLLSATNLGASQGIYTRMYRIIANANFLIANVEDNPNVTDETILGEALFLRALAYYHLTHLWGDIVYFRDDLTIDERRVLSQTPKETIFEDMVADLQRAENLMSADLPSGNREGRANRWAAKTLRMKYHLTQNDWDGVRQAGEEILTSSPHMLADSYDDLWYISNGFSDTDHPEIIFKSQRISGEEPGGTGGNIGDMHVPRLGDQPGDGNSEIIDGMTLRETLTANGELFNGFGINLGLPSFVESIAADDTRQATIATDTYRGFKLGVRGDELDISDPNSTRYLSKFWGLLEDANPRGGRGVDFPVFRLADVKLMLAEAYNNLGLFAQASEQINDIQIRAYEPDRPVFSSSDQSLIAETIFNERRWELAGEGHRRYDLNRWGRLIEEVLAQTYINELFNPTGNIGNEHLLWPFPIDDFEFLEPGQIEQNPGY
ncbi:RagB/SusD family nutrient uptake outer membrane protein [Muricauda sp. SCSIO 64092]|uniref:RagB/SusD family nutrient uptake outer membrane protein n=1 Tax=Allomuricauda sp. SCSIO 64092 TaxID=2908842 RepID=UPI001FF6914E|nr:RagB/SusD family nutrient uptake outer membrane protein [Muricauda sp. SCSIO 64092]UOY05779.1 RagB/SusD family nutrient uptake outer membrane protein [Muricauda sp. SCSIO 64092]